MKSLIIFSISILFVGCGSSYLLSERESVVQYYKDRNVIFIVGNDSLFTAYAKTDSNLGYVYDAKRIIISKGDSLIRFRNISFIESKEKLVTENDTTFNVISIKFNQNLHFPIHLPEDPFFGKIVDGVDFYVFNGIVHHIRFIRLYR